MDYEEYSLHSPAPHLVPSSPFIFTHDTNSQVAKVPDIDRMNRRVPIGRFTNVAQPSPLVTLSQNSQQDSQLQRLPGTPNVNTSSKQSKDTPSIEQVVPNCSPSIINDEKPNIEDELKNSKNGLLPPYKECEDNDRGLLSQIKLEKPPDDEKSNIHSKRRNRRMPENSNTKNFEFFEEDGIFA